MTTGFQRKAALTLAFTFSSTVAIAYCPPQYMETSVAPMFASAVTALNTAIQGVDATLTVEMEMYNQRVLSAVAILTKQKALAANQISDANRTAAQATAMSLNVLGQTERVKQARFHFGPEFGQGFQPCAVYAERNLIANRDAEMGEERRTRIMSEIIAAPGRYVDPIAAQQVQAKEHRELFCTADQVKSGMCEKVGPMAGASLTAATLFDPVMEADQAYRAKVAFVNNVVGLPDAPVPQAAANSEAAATYALAKAKKDALMSPALASLKEVQLDYTGVTSAHGGSDIPLATRMQREVARYLGNTVGYQLWAKAMAGQNTRGLLVEMLKVKALDLVLLEKQYRQFERMEASVSVLVAGELQGKAERANDAAQKASGDSVRSQIK